MYVSSFKTLMRLQYESHIEVLVLIRYVDKYLLRLNRNQGLDLYF